MFLGVSTGPPAVLSDQKKNQRIRKSSEDQKNGGRSTRRPDGSADSVIFGYSVIVNSKHGYSVIVNSKLGAQDSNTLDRSERVGGYIYIYIYLNYIYYCIYIYMYCIYS